MKKIETRNAPEAIGPYSQGILVHDTLYVSGQIPFVPSTMTVISDSIEDQTRQALANVLGIVQAAGMEKEHIVKCTVLMKDLGQFAQMNAVYADFFESHAPARAAYEVVRLPRDVLIEIEAIAVK